MLTGKARDFAEIPQGKGESSVGLGLGITGFRVKPLELEVQSLGLEVKLLGLEAKTLGLWLRTLGRYRVNAEKLRS